MLILHNHITYGFVLEHAQSQRTLRDHRLMIPHLCSLATSLQEQRDKYEDLSGIFFFPLQLNALLTAVLRTFMSKTTHEYICNMELQVAGMI